MQVKTLARLEQVWKQEAQAIQQQHGAHMHGLPDTTRKSARRAPASADVGQGKLS